ncbi:outer membrane beta-barrel protein [Longibacter salinarum]|nr:outer membrane beta-barrel protein [Longibacter salinarum]
MTRPLCLIRSEVFRIAVSCILVGLTAATLLSSETMAQEAEPKSNTERLFLQISLDGQSIDYRDDAFSETDNGGGLSLRAGWGVSPLVTIYVGVTGASIDGQSSAITGNDYSWSGGELGLRLNFRSGRSLVPYADVALRGVAATEDDRDVEFRGGGFTLGGGVSYFFTPAVALDAGLHFGGGRFDEVQVGNISAGLDEDEFGYGEGRFSLGLTFYPLR